MLALAMLRLVALTLILGFACYGVGLYLRIFRPSYRDFRYRLSLPIVAGCVGSIGALLITTQCMSLFLVDALYRLALVRQYPGFIIGTLDFAAYAFGGYYSTKYAVRLAHKLDVRRNAERDYQASRATTSKSLIEVGRDLFRTEEPTKPISHEGKDK
jgi:hypothetical protein